MNLPTALYEIPISLFRQYAFCPRIVHFQLIRDYRPVYPQWVEAGENEHLFREKRIQKKLPVLLSRLNGKIEYNVNVRSHRGFYGICDAVIKTKDQIVPLEFKANIRSLNRGTVLQLTGYSLALEEMLGQPIRGAYILYGHRAKFSFVEITERARQDFNNVLKKIQDLLTNGEFPDSPAGLSQCAQCEYLNFCNDRQV